MASPHPKPTKMKVIEGNPGRRPLPDNEPQPDIPLKMPNPPDCLGEEAEDEWNTAGPALYRLGLLTELDLSAFMKGCIAHGIVVSAANKIKDADMIIVTDKGNEIQNPIFGILNRAMEISLKFDTEFGRTPSSRSKVTAAKTEKKSKFYGLISGKEKVG